MPLHSAMPNTNLHSSKLLDNDTANLCFDIYSYLIGLYKTNYIVFLYFLSYFYCPLDNGALCTRNEKKIENAFSRAVSNDKSIHPTHFGNGITHCRN